MGKRVELDSSAIGFVTYDSDAKTLDLEFRKGARYRYFNVPEFVFLALRKAESAGAFWNEIKDNYRFELLD